MSESVPITALVPVTPSRRLPVPSAGHALVTIALATVLPTGAC